MYLVVNSGRMVQKIVTNTGTPFAVSPSGDHTDGSWLPYHLYDGEIGVMSPTAQVAIRISGTIHYLTTSTVTGSPTLPVGTSAQTLRYDSGGNLVANDVLKNDGSDVFITTTGGNTGRLLSTINSTTAHNILLRNLNAGGVTYIEFQNSAGSELYDIGINSGDLSILNTAGYGISLDTNAKAKLTQNNAAIHEILILQNLNSSAPVYLTFLNSASAEKFYVGYRQAQTRFDILSADNVVGLVVDANGRTGVGIFNNAYTVPDQGSVFTVETRSDLSAYGMTIRHVANSGVNAPIQWQYTNSGATLVYYASVMGDIVSDANSAHYGKLTFQVAISGVMTTRLVVDANGIGVIYGGTGKNSVAQNKFLYTSATSVFSEAAFQDVAEQTYGGSAPAWTGTPPAGATTHVYTWTRIGSQVLLKVWLKYATGGTSNTQVTFDLPSDCPPPREPGGLGATNDKLYMGTGYIDSALTGVPPACRAVLKNKSTSTYEIIMSAASIAALCAHCSIWYEAA